MKPKTPLRAIATSNYNTILTLTTIDYYNRYRERRVELEHKAWSIDNE